ncbi:MAG: S41 family peptidase, partial [Bryobacteraceae bacterium]
MGRRRRLSFLFPAIIVASSILGGVYGSGLSSAAAASSSEDGIRDSVDAFTRVYALVERNFADPVNPDRAMYKGAIPGMLRTLDPHSNFFDPHEFQILREDQRGHYFGVGMQIGVSRPASGKTIVIAPFPGSPAYRAGIRPGDVVLAVDDKPTEKLSLSEIADLLKGPRGTRVKVTLGREGSEAPLTFNLVRDEIPRKSVPDAFWIRPGIAYVAIDSFNVNTGREMEDNLRRLGESNIQGLILDLRENRGGLLNEAVEVAGHFLRKDQTVVSHRGRSEPEQVFRAKTGNQGRQYPVVVLVNRNTASASEIVAGALQDHDRAWVMGENTFGKGLVQAQFPLSEDAALLLTIARYYTPSGRLIQRDYSHRSFFDYYYHNRQEDAQNSNDVKMTDGGRT